MILILFARCLTGSTRYRIHPSFSPLLSSAHLTSPLAPPFPVAPPPPPRTCVLRLPQPPTAESAQPYTQTPVSSRRARLRAQERRGSHRDRLAARDPLAIRLPPAADTAAAGARRAWGLGGGAGRAGRVRGGGSGRGDCGAVLRAGVGREAGGGSVGRDGAGAGAAGRVWREARWLRWAVSARRARVSGGCCVAPARGAQARRVAACVGDSDSESRKLSRTATR